MLAYFVVFDGVYRAENGVYMLLLFCSCIVGVILNLEEVRIIGEMLPVLIQNKFVVRCAIVVPFVT